MLVVKIELWPGGNPEGARTLGSIFIANDGVGTDKYGNYKYFVRGQRATLKGGEGKIMGYPRKEKHSWELVRRILNVWSGASK